MKSTSKIKSKELVVIFFKSKNIFDVQFSKLRALIVISYPTNPYTQDLPLISTSQISISRLPSNLPTQPNPASSQEWERNWCCRELAVKFGVANSVAQAHLHSKTPSCLENQAGPGKNYEIFFWNIFVVGKIEKYLSKIFCRLKIWWKSEK